MRIVKLGTFSPHSMGADAVGVLPEAVRLIDLHIRLPRHQVAMLEHFAERERTSVSSVLARELDGVASGTRGGCRKLGHRYQTPPS